MNTISPHFQKEYEYITEYAVQNNSIEDSGLRRLLGIKVDSPDKGISGRVSLSLQFSGKALFDTPMIQDVLLSTNIMINGLRSVLYNKELAKEGVTFFGHPTYCTTIKYFAIIEYDENINLYKISMLSSAYITDDNPTKEYVIYITEDVARQFYDDISDFVMSLAAVNANYIERFTKNSFTYVNVLLARNLFVTTIVHGLSVGLQIVYFNELPVQCHAIIFLINTILFFGIKKKIKGGKGK